MKRVLSALPVYSEAQADAFFSSLLLPALHPRALADDGDLVGVGIPLAACADAPGVSFDTKFPFIEPVIHRGGLLTLGRDDNVSSDAFSRISAYTKHMKRNVRSLGPLIDAAQAILDIHDFANRHPGLLAWVTRDILCVTVWETDDIFAAFPYGPEESDPEALQIKSRLIRRILMDSDITGTQLSAHRM